MGRRTFISTNRRIKFSVPRQFGEVDTLRLVSVTGGQRMERGGTHKLLEGVALVALRLERETWKATAVRRLLSVEPDLGSAPAMIWHGDWLKVPEQFGPKGRYRGRERPRQKGHFVDAFLS